MNTKSIIEIFRGDDSDALGYQTIVGTIHTDLDLTGCKAVFRYLGFFQEFDPIPEDGKLTIVIPSASSMQFPPGFGYASLKVYDIDRKVRTFTNRIPVFVKTMTPCRGGGEFDVEFSPFPELAPLKIFKGPNADDFDLYTGFISKIIDRASAQKYGLSMLFDAMDAEKTAEGGCAASPAAVKAAYDAVIGVLTDNYYTKTQTDEAIDKLAAYYITSDTQGNPFATHAALVNATTYYSGGSVRTPTRNDYTIVVADETHNNEEWRYIYSENVQGVGQWEPQYAVEGVITFDDNVTRTSANAVKSSGIWSALWGALAALPMGFSSLYDWCVSQLAGKLNNTTDTMSGTLAVYEGLTVGFRKDGSATGRFSSTQGRNNEARGGASHAEGESTTAQNNAEHAQGKYNVSHTGTISAENTLSSIGFGGSDSDRKNAVETMQDGKTFIYGLGGYDGTNPTATDVKDLATTINGKADKPATFTNGNFATLDKNGNPVDSGKKPRDFQSALTAQQLANIAAVSDALAFDATHTYVAGDPVVYLGTLYTFTATHTGAWTGSDVSAVDIIARLAGKLSITSTAPQFQDEETVYQPGRLVVYNGSLYVCTQQHYGPWNADHFSAQDVVDSAISRRVDSKVDKLTVYTTNNLASIDEFGNIADSGIAKANVAQKPDIPYDLGTPTVINTASSEVVEGETVNYGAATLANRTANIVQVTTQLDELRITFPAATSGKVRDFGLRVEVGNDSAVFAELVAPALVPIAPTGETIKIENADGTIPELADGTATAKGVTLLYFSETAPGVFVVKGEQVEEVA